jgi:hypothetical protein
LGAGPVAPVPSFAASVEVSCGFGFSLGAAPVASFAASVEVSCELGVSGAGPVAPPSGAFAGVPSVVPSFGGPFNFPLMPLMILAN